MQKSPFVFTQLTKFISRSYFNDLVRKYNGDRYVKTFTCWNQLLTLMFGQLSNRQSMRDLIAALEAHQSKCYHLGVSKRVTRSNLAKANEERDYRIFEDFAFYMMAEARRLRIDHIFQLDGNVYAFDSTTISLCLSVFEWAKFRKHKGGIKVHTLFDIETQVPAFIHITNAKPHDVTAMDVIPYESGSYYVFDRAYNHYKRLYRIHSCGSFFVVRAKKNLKYKTVKWVRRLPKNILSDAQIELTDYYPSKHYPETLRLVKYWDEENQREFTYLTNAKHLTAQQVADLYKSRWHHFALAGNRIHNEHHLFFKWLKQHLRIKRFWGTSENAVRIQVYVAITTFCMVAIMQHKMKLSRSTYEILQILNLSLTDTTPLVDLLNKTNFQDVKDQSSSGELLLF